MGHGLNYFDAISRPKKVLIFMSLPFQWPSKWICPHQNHYVPRHINNSLWRHSHTSCESSKPFFHLAVRVWGGGAAGSHRRGGDRATWRGDRETWRGGWAKWCELTRRRGNLKQLRLMLCSWRPREVPRVLPSLSPLCGSPRRGGP
jgi:hypothetical protein